MDNVIDKFQAAGYLHSLPAPKGGQNLVLILPVEFEQEFKSLIQAGCNLNPHLSPAMKSLCDVITTGKVQQDYYAQAKSPTL